MRLIASFKVDWCNKKLQSGTEGIIRFPDQLEEEKNDRTRMGTKL